MVVSLARRFTCRLNKPGRSRAGPTVGYLLAGVLGLFHADRQATFFGHTCHARHHAASE